MMTLIGRSAIVAGVAFAVASAMPVLAGGDDYDAKADTEGKGPAYFGFVRDSRGSAVPGAQVMLKPKSGEPVTIKTNVLGLYRSHVRKGVQPDDVEVSCAKDGFKQTRIYRRTPPGSKNMFIETDCTLTKL